MPILTRNNHPAYHNSSLQKLTLLSHITILSLLCLPSLAITTLYWPYSLSPKIQPPLPFHWLSILPPYALTHHNPPSLSKFPLSNSSPFFNLSLTDIPSQATTKDFSVLKSLSIYPILLMSTLTRNNHPFISHIPKIHDDRSTFLQTGRQHDILFK